MRPQIGGAVEGGAGGPEGLHLQRPLAAGGTRVEPAVHRHDGGDGSGEHRGHRGGGREVDQRQDADGRHRHGGGHDEHRTHPHGQVLHGGGVPHDPGQRRPGGAVGGQA
ncbi:hypothetical protein, partial [Candidatus Blastococcus massiliensis]|uniref:hypothetical protein n=1 Tax=Candidatus Blastococcus massiliensis TaxID=1470358 RepID=UPI001E4372A4